MLGFVLLRGRLQYPLCLCVSPPGWAGFLFAQSYTPLRETAITSGNLFTSRAAGGASVPDGAAWVTSTACLTSSGIAGSRKRLALNLFLTYLKQFSSHSFGNLGEMHIFLQENKFITLENIFNIPVHT